MKNLPYPLRCLVIPAFALLAGCGPPDAPAGSRQAETPTSHSAADPSGSRRTERIYSPRSQIDQLRSLPYADATFDPEGGKSGVTVYEKGRAFEGLNFYSSRTLPAAFLVDMDGQLLYQWRGNGQGWQHVDLLPSGEVIALVKDSMLFKVDLRSKVLWQYRARVHHDHFRTSDGRIFVLSRKEERIPQIHPRHRILVDYVTILSAKGNFIAEHSVLELFQRSRFAFLLPIVAHRDYTEDGEKPEDVILDIFHTNHVEVMDGSLSDRAPIFAKGLVLLSVRHLNAVVVADLEKGEVIWVWGPANLKRQHDPTVLPNGNLLIFNNGFVQSSVLELDPVRFEVVWRYNQGKEFFSASRGSNQRLPNGNTLITESDTGYVFEVTPEGETVWEFANPQINKKSERSAIWRMTRFRREELPFLETLLE